MIKNIVFDIGDVLVGYLPKKEVENLGTSLKRIGEANRLIREDKIWREYINGLTTIEEVLPYYTNLNKEYKLEFEIILKKENQKYIVYEIKNNTKILEDLSKRYNIYILSNINKDICEYIMENFEFKNKIQGGIYSFKEHISKPDKRIFKSLINTYSINPEETIYVDDKEKNIAVAKELGFTGIQCKLEDNLEELLKKEEIYLEYTGDNC